MKNTVFILIAISIFISCNSKMSESNNRAQVPKDTTSIVHVPPPPQPSQQQHNHEDSVIYSIPPTKIGKLKELSFKFIVDTSKYNLKTIIIYSNKKVIQKIIANKDCAYGERKPELIDWNFDGYKDISVLNSCGSGGCSYWIWIYSPSKKKYIYNKELSEVLGLEIDTTNQYIVFHYRFGVDWEYWDSLKYKNNKLIFVKGLYSEMWHDSNGKYWTKNKYSKRINNKVVVTKIDSFINK